MDQNDLMALAARCAADAWADAAMKIAVTVTLEQALDLTEPHDAKELRLRDPAAWSELRRQAASQARVRAVPLPFT